MDSMGHYWDQGRNSASHFTSLQERLTPIPNWYDTQSASASKTLPKSVLTAHLQVETSSWQHQVPETMPWGSRISQERLTEFKGITTLPVNTQMGSPRRATKRRGPRVNDLSSGCPPRKEYISEEKMVAHMSRLSLVSQPSPDPAQPAMEAYCLRLSDTATSMPHSSQAVYFHSQRSFNELDSRLNVIEEEDENDANNNDTSDTGPRLHISSQIESHIKAMKETSILPRKIIQEIVAPCMQVVLWKPQDNIIKDIVSETVNSSGPSSIDSGFMDSADLDDHLLEDSGQSKQREKYNSEQGEMELAESQIMNSFIPIDSDCGAAQTIDLMDDEDNMDL